MFPVMPIHRCVHGCIVCEVCMCVCRRKAWACVCAAAPLPPGWVLCALAGMALTSVIASVHVTITHPPPPPAPPGARRRLDEEPTGMATLADQTSDSDGKIDRFINTTVGPAGWW